MAALVLTASLTFPAQARVLADVAGTAPPLTASAGASEFARPPLSVKRDSLHPELSLAPNRVDALAQTGNPQGNAALAPSARSKTVVLLAGMCSSTEGNAGQGSWVRQWKEWIRREFGYSVVEFSYSAEGPNRAYIDVATARGVRDSANNLLAIYRERDDDIYLIGHSLGGLVAAYAASGMPEEFRRRTTALLTFNSPLKGVSDFRSLLSIAGCWALRDPILDDLRESGPNSVLAAVRDARWDHLAAVNFTTRRSSPSDHPWFEDFAVPWDRAVFFEKAYTIIEDNVPWVDLKAGTHESLVTGIHAACCNRTVEYVRRALRDQLLPFGSEKGRVELIRRLYRELLSREPDAEGLNHWYRSGLSELQLRQAFVQSGEYRRKVITGYYRELLGRDPDAPGLDNWVNSGLPLDRVRLGFLRSEEYLLRRTEPTPTPRDQLPTTPGPTVGSYYRFLGPVQVFRGPGLEQTHSLPGGTVVKIIGGPRIDAQGRRWWDLSEAEWGGGRHRIRLRGREQLLCARDIRLLG